MLRSGGNQRARVRFTGCRTNPAHSNRQTAHWRSHIVCAALNILLTLRTWANGPDPKGEGGREERERARERAREREREREREMVVEGDVLGVRR